MCAKQRILQFELDCEIIVQGKVGISTCRETELVITCIMIAIDLGEGGASDEAGIEALCLHFATGKE